MGRRPFDIVGGPNIWTKDMAYGAQPAIAATDGHIVIMGGGGTPLFRVGTRQKYRQPDVRPSSNAVHLIYERPA